MRRRKKLIHERCDKRKKSRTRYFHKKRFPWLIQFFPQKKKVGAHTTRAAARTYKKNFYRAPSLVWSGISDDEKHRPIAGGIVKRREWAAFRVRYDATIYAYCNRQRICKIEEGFLTAIGMCNSLWLLSLTALIFSRSKVAWNSSAIYSYAKWIRWCVGDKRAVAWKSGHVSGYVKLTCFWLWNSVWILIAPNDFAYVLICCRA